MKIFTKMDKPAIRNKYKSDCRKIMQIWSRMKTIVRQVVVANRLPIQAATFYT